MRRCPQCYNSNASVVDDDWTDVSGGGPAFPDCCFAAKVRVPSTDAGRFSVLVKEQETTVEAVRLWNPGCALCSAPCSIVTLIPCHIETLTPWSAAVRTTAAPTSSMGTNPVSRDPVNPASRSHGGSQPSLRVLFVWFSTMPRRSDPAERHNG